MKASRISAQEFISVNESQQVTIVDVRTPIEVATEYISGSLYLPLQTLTEKTFTQITLSIMDVNKPIYILCQRGIRADSAVKKLEHLKDVNLIVIDGGLNELKAKGQQTKKGSSDMITLDRQVNIASGLIVLIGMLLGATIYSYFYTLSTLIGLGLLFSGITHINLLGIILTKMPWNHPS